MTYNIFFFFLVSFSIGIQKSPPYYFPSNPLTIFLLHAMLLIEND